MPNSVAWYCCNDTVPIGLLDEELTNAVAGRDQVFDPRRALREVSHRRCVRDCAVLKVIGIDAEDHRCILGVNVALSEAEAHCGLFEEPARARIAWPGDDRQRCARGIQGSAASLPQ